MICFLDHQYAAVAEEEMVDAVTTSKTKKKG